MAKVYSSLKYLSKGAWLSLKKKERKREKRKRKFMSPHVEKNEMMKREEAMPPTRKEDAMKGVKFHIYHTHALSWSRFMTCCSFYPSV
jgi:ribosome maturation protein Sdo1